MIRDIQIRLETDYINKLVISMIIRFSSIASNTIKLFEVLYYNTFNLTEHYIMDIIIILRWHLSSLYLANRLQSSVKNSHVFQNVIPISLYILNSEYSLCQLDKAIFHKISISQSFIRTMGSSRK